MWFSLVVQTNKRFAHGNNLPLYNRWHFQGNDGGQFRPLFSRFWATRWHAMYLEKQLPHTSEFCALAVTSFIHAIWISILGNIGFRGHRTWDPENTICSVGKHNTDTAKMNQKVCRHKITCVCISRFTDSFAAHRSQFLFQRSAGLGRRMEKAQCSTSLLTCQLVYSINRTSSGQKREIWPRRPRYFVGASHHHTLRRAARGGHFP